MTRHEEKDLTANPGSSKELQPGDRVVEGDHEYQVQAIEKNQGRLLVTDTDGLAHSYPAGSS